MGKLQDYKHDSAHCAKLKIAREQFRKYLEELLEENAMTQKDLSEKIPSTKRQTITSWVLGSGYPDLYTRIKIAEILHGDIRKMLRPEEEQLVSIVLAQISKDFLNK